MNSDNPYSATSESQGSRRPGSGALVPQVRIVAILMIVQAVLELLFGAYFVVMGVAMPALMANQPNQMPPEQQEMFNKFFLGYFLIAGGCAIVIALIRLVAGILGVTYRGRMLGIVSHIGGLLTIATCYCFPTAIAVGIYGCIIYFNADVAQAFKLRSDGLTSEQVLAHFR